MQVVPFERTAQEREKEQPERLSLISSGGADCRLHNFRLFIKTADKSVVVITADRAFGETYGDAQPVMFKFYRLTVNREGLLGNALLFFQQFDERVSEAAYCDVDVAFEKKLGVGGDGRPLSEAALFPPRNGS